MYVTRRFVKHLTFHFSAVAGDDFVPNPSLSITFPTNSQSNDMNECASIDIVNDINIECEHSFTVEVGDIMCDVDPPITSASPSATVTIDDDDGMLSFTLQYALFYTFCLIISMMHILLYKVTSVLFLHVYIKNLFQKSLFQ